MQIATNTSSLLGLDAPTLWSTQSAFEHLQSIGKADTKRTAERRLHELEILPPALTAENLIDDQNTPANQLLVDWALKRSRSKRQLVLFAQLGFLPDGKVCLYANDSRGARYWRPLTALQEITLALQELQRLLNKEIVLFPSGTLTGELEKNTLPKEIKLPWCIFPSKTPFLHCNKPNSPLPTRLRQLEAESIHMLREAAAESSKPALLFAGGKDSAVLLHLARKAFHPAPPPFPLLHIDTQWQFRETYLFRNRAARDSGMDLIVHSNPEATARDINPFDHGAKLHQEIADTDALHQAIERYQLDLLICGRRRDDAPQQKTERVFSCRDPQHRKPAALLPPDIWNLYNTHKPAGHNIRCLPLADWREVDIWRYIQQQGIAVPALYFAQERPVVIRSGKIYLIDDARFRLLPGEEIVEKRIRFRSLGCYPLTSAIESDANGIPEILEELASLPAGENHSPNHEASVAPEVRRIDQYNR